MWQQWPREETRAPAENKTATANAARSLTHSRFCIGGLVNTDWTDRIGQYYRDAARVSHSALWPTGKK